MLTYFTKHFIGIFWDLSVVSSQIHPIFVNHKNKKDERREYLESAGNKVTGQFY